MNTPSKTDNIGDTAMTQFLYQSVSLKLCQKYLPKLILFIADIARAVCVHFRFLMLKKTL